jgi:hypothetical protein
LSGQIPSAPFAQGGRKGIIWHFSQEHKHAAVVNTPGFGDLI